MRYISGGESHGLSLTAIIEGLPAGLQISSEYINEQLRRRQKGYGRGGRMKLESDEVEFISGLRFNETLGTPLTLSIKNRDSVNWKENMAAEGDPPADLKKVTAPRPGHADYAGAVKYLRKDFRDILERSSARETAMRVAVGTVARSLLDELGVSLYSHVVSVGKVTSEKPCSFEGDYLRVTEPDIYRIIENSPLRCASPGAEKSMIDAIEEARENGDTLGGIFEIIVTGVPPGLGSHVQWDRKIDGRLCGAIMSLQGIKGVEIGLGFLAGVKPGSEVHDPFTLSADGRIIRSGNRAGGIEGGVTNGEPLIVRAAMKPIPTLMKPLQSIDFASCKASLAAVERSDVCAVPAASIVGESIVAWELAVAVLDKFSRDSMIELKEAYSSYLEMIASYRHMEG